MVSCYGSHGWETQTFLFGEMSVRGVAVLGGFGFGVHPIDRHGFLPTGRRCFPMVVGHQLSCSGRPIHAWLVWSVIPEGGVIWVLVGGAVVRVVLVAGRGRCPICRAVAAGLAVCIVAAVDRPC